MLNKKAQQYIALEHYDIQDCQNHQDLAEKLDTIIAGQELLQQDFASVSVSMMNSLNTLIPKELFKEENARDILVFNQALLQNEDESHDWLASIKAYNSYVIPEELQRCFIKHFPNLSWIHHSSIFIESLMRQYKFQEGKKIYLSIQDKHFDLAVLNGKQLSFYNSFHFKATEDLIYYLLFTCEQLGLNPDQIPLIIAGELEKESNVYKLIYRYIRNVSFIDRNPNYQYSFVFDDLKAHYYYKLLNQHLCVS